MTPAHSGVPDGTVMTHLILELFVPPMRKLEPTEFGSNFGSDRPRIIDLPAGTTVLGRDGRADIVVPHPTISTRHAAFFRLDDAVFLDDLGSANGTGRNNRLLRARERLCDGDVLTFGRHVWGLMRPQLASAVEPLRSGVRVIVDGLGGAPALIASRTPLRALFVATGPTAANNSGGSSAGLRLSRAGAASDGALVVAPIEGGGELHVDGRLITSARTVDDGAVVTLQGGVRLTLTPTIGVTDGAHTVRGEHGFVAFVPDDALTLLR